MGFRRRTRPRALIAGAVIGGAAAHHAANQAGPQQQAYNQAPAGYDQDQDQAEYSPRQVDPADEIEHLVQLHTSGALRDEEFAAAKEKALGS